MQSWWFTTIDRLKTRDVTVSVRIGNVCVSSYLRSYGKLDPCTVVRHTLTVLVGQNLVHSDVQVLNCGQPPPTTVDLLRRITSSAATNTELPRAVMLMVNSGQVDVAAQFALMFGL